ncbi:MAG: CRISPR-associated protein [Candidatus Accumulibacter phosphatis]|uniref:CRISPR-associated protein n=1 Tax=Candidatus Accumulibacter phosphatis TaxID=327160 RepID=A0A080LT37_9PROT|nr:TIGR03986 family CRISPR-associated RAMP protein [Accumulibacter sp.]KFB71596.1 MAG: CRISPR-associated protein [Candidatus Accumulibacter phosphatis]HRF06888.1 TIGR03986 family CRISPR-associated RAMP protein [Accumulibacter sp.]
MMHGEIKEKRANGSGYIHGEDGIDYFFHLSGLRGVRFEQIAEGDSVCFELQPNDRHPGKQKAVKVQRDATGNSRIATAARSQTTAAANPPVTVDLYPPYCFVPVNVQHAATDKPVWHDGNGGGDLLSGELLCTLTALTPLLPGNDRYDVADADSKKLEEWRFTDLPGGKKIAEPLRLNDGRVVIPGSALKGMLRHSLGALLSAPMERVGERRYTYRPNLDFSKKPLAIETRPAIIAALSGGSGVKVLPDPRSAVFKSHEKPAGAASFSYCGGIDGEGILAGVAQRKTYVYKKAFVISGDIEKAVLLPISAKIHAAYEETQEVLSQWHISECHPSDFDREKVAKAIRKATPLEVGQLIYVEVAIDEKTRKPREILSLGHHFRYRWAYTSSIRRKGGKLRACLSPLAGEALEEKKPLERPKLLSGSRLLFGYVHDENNPIGAGVFQRLAGRIAINHALSESEPQFLGEESKGWCIPLPILGQPKPSAWEFYLQQKPGSRLPATYGDLPGDEGGDLAGRKFYRHQPRIRTAKDLGSGAVAETQATLARFICQPQTTFRFTLRFARLRCWELGALLAVLEPQRLAKDDAEYAHKLGLGRPLGMGSVSIGIDRIRVRNESQTRLAEQPGLDQQALACLREKLDQASLDRWLESHRFVDRGRVGYPTQEVRGESIYHWHTDIRKEYSKLRRERAPNAAALLSKILKGQNLLPKK